MKRSFILLMALVAGTLAWVFAQAGATPRPVAALFPPGAVLYLEAIDFQSLIKDWNNSQEKRLWLSSDNYQIFNRSNLFLKLQNAQNEFASAAGIPPNNALLDDIAGSQSAVAIYDIGELQFLYITRMPAARFAQSALWKVRGNYQPRKSAGLDYYVHTDRASKRVAAFAAAQDYLMLATQEDALAGALALLANQTAPNITQEQWFSKPIQAAKQPGELRLVLNMGRLLDSPYMRSYWIQRNASELKQYSSAISDVRRTPSQLVENRMLLRAEETQPTWDENAVSQIVRLAPANAGFYQAWASPSPEQALDLIRRKIFEPRTDSSAEKKNAPEVGSLDQTVGSESDLETRIDEPPFDAGQSSALPEAVRHVIESAKLDAMLQIESSRVLSDGSFVGIDRGVVLLAASDWNSASVSAAAAGMTGGLAEMEVGAKGKLLVAATRPLLVQAVLSGLANGTPTPPARYAAHYRHLTELPNFLKLTSLIDSPLKTDGPAFFSGNIASLGRALGRLDSATISVHDTGAVVSQDVVYRWRP